jgi:hypothetical protein
VGQLASSSCGASPATGTSCYSDRQQADYLPADGFIVEGQAAWAP